MEYNLPIAVSQRTIDVLKRKVPRIQHSLVPSLHDQITTQLWGVLHPTYSLPQANALLLDFLMDTEKLPKNMGSYCRENRIFKGVAGGEEGGIGAEYFFLDYLMRNSHQREDYSFTHRKGPHILDHIVKADILSTVYRHDGEQVQKNTFGTQIQYCKLKKNYPEHTHNELKKEKDVLHGISSEKYIINALPEELRPQIPCLVRLNSQHFLAQIPELQQKRTFLHALEQRQLNGFHGGGPTQHLPYNYLKTLRQMSFYYQKSCISFLRFIENAAEGKRTHLISKKPTLTSHESAFRVNTFNPSNGRATYDFYRKTGSQQQLLTIVYRVPDELRFR